VKELNWCKEQKKGIRFCEPNDNLCKEFFHKAQNALKAMISLKGNSEWEISSAYYAMYFSIYALCLQIGVTCEIHSCTLLLMKTAFKDYFSTKDIQIVHNSQKARVDLQYYSNRNIANQQKQELLQQAKRIHALCKNISDKLTQENIKTIKKTIQK